MLGRRRFLFLAMVVAVGVASVWFFRADLRRLQGINPDAGLAAETDLMLPSGFRATVFAAGLAEPQFMTVATDGTLLVAERGMDRIVALPDVDGDGVADSVHVVGSGYGSAHSLAVESADTLLVAGSSAIYRVTLDAQRVEVGRDVFLEVPAGGQHVTRTVAIRPDGRVLISIGSTCNVCEESDPRRAAVLEAPATGGSARVVTRGLRNAVGIAIDPATGDGWVTNNGRDGLGDDQPMETVYRLIDGGDAGWPRCHAGDLPDPEFGGRIGCEGVLQPAVQMTPHAAPLGIAFWRGHAVIALHGSWNRSTKSGYEVRWIPWSDGPTGSDVTLVGGFLDATTGQSTGRPAGVQVGADGALYVSDDKAGFIYRITGP